MTTAFSHLQRAMQKLGLEEAIPDLSQASDAELRAPFDKFLSFAECHKDYGISENFNPKKLPEVDHYEISGPIDFSEDENDENDDEFGGFSRPHLMKPYFSTTLIEEVVYKLSQGPVGARCPRFIPSLDSDHFLGCRLFFRDLNDAIQHGFRIVSAKSNDSDLRLVVCFKRLRRLKALPNTAETKDTLLLEVDYSCMSEDDFEECNEGWRQHGGDMPSTSFSGSEDQLLFIKQVLQAHERLLDESVIAEHDREWDNDENIRPSFIVPLRPLALCPSSTEEILQEIKRAFHRQAILRKEIMIESYNQAKLCKSIKNYFEELYGIAEIQTGNLASKPAELGALPSGQEREVICYTPSSHPNASTQS